MKGLVLLALAAGCTQDKSTNDLSASTDDLSGILQDLTAHDFSGAQPDGGSDGAADASSGKDGAIGDMAHTNDAAPVGVDGYTACATSSCAPPEFCCWKSGGQQCKIGDGVVNCGVQGGTPIYCDSTANCPAGRTCCFLSGVVDCALTCTSTVVCDPARSECTTGTCKPYTGPQLPPGYYTCQ